MPDKGSEFKYRLQLEELTTEGAVFKRVMPGTEEVLRPTLVLDTLVWGELDRPGYLEVTVKEHVAP